MADKVDTPGSGGEEWRPVVGWEHLYEVSSAGRVRSVDRIVTRRVKGRILQPCLTPSGYPKITLSKNGKVKDRSVHSLVAEAFIGPLPAGKEVAHNDGNKKNAVASNLRYATHAENLADRIQHGTMNWGDRGGAALLTEAQAILIRRSSEPTKVLAERYSVSTGTIGAIRAGRRWKHLQ